MGYDKTQDCSRCFGEGVILSGPAKVKCPKCNGSGNK